MGGVVDSIFGGGDDGASAARDASEIQAQYQREALDYLKERERLPSAFREGAMSILGGLYGLQPPAAQAATAPQSVAAPQQMAQPGRQYNQQPTFTEADTFPMYNPNSILGQREQQQRRQGLVGRAVDQVAQPQPAPAQPAEPAGMSQQEALSALMDNPIYQAALGDIGAQEEAILRNQSATGALRGAGTDLMLAENQRRNRYGALQASLGGLQGLAGLPSNAGAIAQQTSNIGQTLGQGMIGAAQSQAAGQQAGFSNLLGLGSLGLAGFAAFCDPALKSNAKRIGEVDGYQIYRWDWNEKAKELGLVGEGVGPMADEIERFEPERIEIRNGYKYVRAAA